MLGVQFLPPKQKESKGESSLTYETSS